MEYDEIYFGKPWANVYIDDNAFRFETWDKIDNKAKSIPASMNQKLNSALTY